MDKQTLVEIDTAASYLLGLGIQFPSLGIVLGSGLSNTIDSLDGTLIPYDQIPGMPRPTVPGHPGKLKVTSQGIYMAGRFHFYEGHPMARVVFPYFLMHRLGVRTLILTNAAGGIASDYNPGDLVFIKDHINLIGTNPLIGPNPEGWGSRFFDMSEAYNRKLLSAAQKAAQNLFGHNLAEGVYAAMTGPSYETPAEIRFLKAIGADLVGMSTVPEAICAGYLGMRVLGISCVTNKAAGLGQGSLNHQEVVDVGAQVTGKMQALLEALVSDPCFQAH